MSLHHEGHAEQTAGSQRDEKIKEHLEHPLVENKTKIVAFRLHDGKDKDREKREREQPDSYQRCDADARRGVQNSEFLQIFEAGEPIPHPDYRSRHQRRNRCIESYDDDRPSANRLKTR